MTRAQLAQLEAQFSDYLEGAMTDQDRTSFEAALATSDDARAAFEEFRNTLDAVSGLHKQSAPRDFDSDVARAIHTRSAGRFFARRGWSGRIPLALLAALAFGILIMAYALMRMSSTGSARLAPPEGAGPGVSEDVKRVIPRL